MEGDAITRAKEFLRRQRRSVQRRQVSVIFSFRVAAIF